MRHLNLKLCIFSIEVIFSRKSSVIKDSQCFQSLLSINISAKLCSKMHKSSKAKFNFKDTSNVCTEDVFKRFSSLGRVS